MFRISYKHIFKLNQIKFSKRLLLSELPKLEMHMKREIFVNFHKRNVCYHLVFMQYKLSFFFCPNSPSTHQYNRSVCCWMQQIKMMNDSRIPGSDFTAHNWQNWKTVFLSCHCHEIHRVDEVCLKSSSAKNALKRSKYPSSF